jgi:hypothetical protein
VRVVSAVTAKLYAGWDDDGGFVTPSTTDHAAAGRALAAWLQQPLPNGLTPTRPQVREVHEHTVAGKPVREPAGECGFCETAAAYTATLAELEQAGRAGYTAGQPYPMANKQVVAALAKWSTPQVGNPRTLEIMGAYAHGYHAAADQAAAAVLAGGGTEDGALF